MATRMVMELRGLEYPERLKIMGFTDLEMRRKRGDLIQLFKIAKGLEEVDLGRYRKRGVKEFVHIALIPD